ncbi:MAG: RNA polymerase sigma factor [Oscillospiraceae bacterium]
MKSDKQLYLSFLNGDNKSFEELIIRHKDNLIFFLQRYIKDIFTCEDIAQDVFAYIFTFKEKYNMQYNFKTYIYTIAKNKAIDYIRKQKCNISIEETNEELFIQDELLDKVFSKDIKNMVQKAISMLKPDYQKIIFLVDFLEFSYKDAAIVMGKTAPQVKIMIFRARKALKKIIEKEGYIYDENYQ